MKSEEKMSLENVNYSLLLHFKFILEYYGEFSVSGQ